MWLLLLKLFVIFPFCPRVSSHLGGAPRIDFPLSKFSLAILVLNSLSSELTLSTSETNTVVLDEAILGEEKSYSKLVLSEATF